MILLITLFEKSSYFRPNKKNYHQNRLILKFSVVSANFIQIGSLVTEIQNFGKDVGLILYDINLFPKV